MKFLGLFHWKLSCEFVQVNQTWNLKVSCLSEYNYIYLFVCVRPIQSYMMPTWTDGLLDKNRYCTVCLVLLLLVHQGQADCPPGTYDDTVDLWAPICRRCYAGFYCRGGSEDYQQCGSGYKCPYTGMVEPVPCTGNTYQDQVDAGD